MTAYFSLEKETNQRFTQLTHRSQEATNLMKSFFIWNDLCILLLLSTYAFVFRLISLWIISNLQFVL